MALQLRVIGGINFQELTPSASPSQGPERFYVRHAGAGPLTIEAQHARGPLEWNAERIAGPTGRIQVSAPRNHYIITRPNDPCAIRITCRADLESRSVEVWYVGCTLVATRSESPAANNPGWPQVAAALRSRYVGGQAFDFPSLGLIQFRFSDASGTGIRYGDFVKLVATVSPANTPLAFFHARRITRASVTAVLPDDPSRNADARGPRVVAPPPGTNDTSAIASGVLTPKGRLFDYDIPGSTMRAFNHPGDQHIWNVEFEQAVGVGSATVEGAWRALAQNARQLVSTQWSVDFSARYNSPPGTMFGEVAITGRASGS